MNYHTLVDRFLILLCLYTQYVSLARSRRQCGKCISCLCPKSTVSINDNRSEVLPAITSIDKGICPKADTDEYLKLQQIEFMYRRNFGKKGAPCLKLCFTCRKSIIKNCRKFQKLKKSYWETFYDGIFVKRKSIPKNISDIKPKSKDTSSSSSSGSKGDSKEKSDESDHYKKNYYNNINGQKPYLKIAAQECCEIYTKVVPYFSSKNDSSGMTWYAVWFSSPTYNYQLIEEAQCSDTCSLVKTTRSFLFTSVKPHPEYGHAFMLFGHHMVNIKFFNDYVGTYCKRQYS